MVTKNLFTALLTIILLFSTQVWGQIQPSRQQRNTPGILTPSGGGGGGGTPSPTTPSTSGSLPFSAKGQFNFTLLASGPVDATLTWSFPKGIIPATTQIVYDNTYTGSTYTMSTPTTTWAKIPRSLPIGLFERWKLIVTDTGGNTYTETIKREADYGGAVLVVEDVYFRPVIDNCGQPDPGIQLYYYVDSCIVTTVNASCKKVTHYEQLTQIAVNPDDVDQVNSCKDSVMKWLRKAVGVDPEVNHCDILGEPISYTYTDDSGRRGVAAPSISFSAYPNPAGEFINVDIDNVSGSARLIITDLQGKTMKSVSLNMAGVSETVRLETGDLRPGMYQLSILHTQGRESELIVIK
jgi:hypothetical protein